MKIGIIGAGEVAIAVAQYALASGHEVVLSNSGDSEKLARVVAQLGAGASAATARDAARADMVLLAVPWLKVKAAMADLPTWEGRILIDATNPFLQITPSWIFEDLGDDTASEVVARLAPGARLVKAFNSLLMSNFTKPPKLGQAQRVLLVSGDDPDANKEVAHLITGFGFAVIDLGPLKTGGRLQQAGGPLAGPDLLVSA
jgi:predicted dinucleotide-binding enzyme